MGVIPVIAYVTTDVTVGVRKVRKRRARQRQAALDAAVASAREEALAEGQQRLEAAMKEAEATRWAAVTTVKAEAAEAKQRRSQASDASKRALAGLSARRTSRRRGSAAGAGRADGFETEREALKDQIWALDAEFEESTVALNEKFEADLADRVQQAKEKAEARGEAATTRALAGLRDEMEASYAADRAAAKEAYDAKMGELEVSLAATTAHLPATKEAVETERVRADAATRDLEGATESKQRWEQLATAAERRINAQRELADRARKIASAMSVGDTEEAAARRIAARGAPEPRRGRVRAAPGRADVARVRAPPEDVSVSPSSARRGGEAQRRPPRRTSTTRRNSRRRRKTGRDRAPDEPDGAEAEA
ncbi:acetylcholine-gated cation-selective channel [Aureococcus anophagefferens]|nr:acetylcholine-gated cation-selective channel [Aureococcus anophagefferens]